MYIGGGGSNTYEFQGRSGLQYPFNGQYPPTSIAYGGAGSNTYFVIGIPEYNNYIGSVVGYEFVIGNPITGDTTAPYYNRSVPFGPPFPLPPYSMFGKQVCIAANGTLLYVSAPSTDGATISSSFPGPSPSTATFDTVFFYQYSTNFDATITPSTGLSISYIFLYQRTPPAQSGWTGWTYVSYMSFPVNGMTVSCSRLANSTIFWNLNQNNNITISQTATSYNLTTIGSVGQCPSQNRTFYISNTTGSDLNSGRSPELAWQTTTHLSSMLQSLNYFTPGDTLLFCKGDIFLQTSLVLTPNAYGLVNPFNCSFRIGSYSCGNPQEFSGHPLPRLYAPQWRLLRNPWTPVNWLSFNQTVNYTALRYYYYPDLGIVNPAMVTYGGGIDKYFNQFLVNNNSYSLAHFPGGANWGGDSITVWLFSDNVCSFSQG